MRSHRGLSSIIGSVFLIAIMIGALSYMTYSLEIMGNFSESLITEEARLKDKQNEAFEISSIDITSASKLDGIIKNTGQIPVKFTTLWIDEQGTNDFVQKFILDTAVAPGKSFNLIDSVDFDMDATKGYNMKLVSSRGEVQSFYVNSASQEPLNLHLMAMPDSIPTEFTTTLLMTVVNNMTNNNVLVNLTPNTMTCVAPGCVKISGPTPASYDTLNAGDVAIFSWVYQLTASDNTPFTFTGSLQNVPSNSDSVTVTVKTVEEANIAGQSLNSLGIGAASYSPDVWVMHIESNGIPSAFDYQLSLPGPDDDGDPFIIFDTGISKKFISANTTAESISIPAGNWNASLRYNSARLPDGMGGSSTNIHGNEGVEYHFNKQNAIQPNFDSGTHGDCYNLSTTLNGVTWGTTNGVNGSAGYRFDGNDSIQVSEGSENRCNSPWTSDFSLAGWFKAIDNVGDHNKKYIWGAGTSFGGNGAIEVYLSSGSGAGNHGNFYFRYYNDDDDQTTCLAVHGGSLPRWMDSQWHHFVVTKDGDQCKIFIDGVLKQTTSGGYTFGKEIDLDGSNIYIGNISTSSSTNGFDGYLDDIMFWNNYELLQADVDAMYGANYGPNAHEMTFIINNATREGTTINNIATATNYPLPYVDQMHHTDVDDLYKGYNYTSPLIPATGLHTTDGNRISFTMSFDKGMALNFRLDDQSIDGISSTLLSSYFQIPKPEQDLPSYFQHNQDEKVKFYVFNAGDEGAWFTYQGTRIIFNGTAGHYAALIDTVDDGIQSPITQLGSDQDGPFIATNAQADLVFWWPQVAPDNSNNAPTPLIALGTYDVTVFLNGYDADGSIFVRSIKLGNVEVVP